MTIWSGSVAIHMEGVRLFSKFVRYELAVGSKIELWHDV
jgi:hypothetical protein